MPYDGRPCDGAHGMRLDQERDETRGDGYSCGNRHGSSDARADGDKHAGSDGDSHSDQHAVSFADPGV